mgnify:FL=1|jgi:uncharacterized protein YaaQ
MKMVMAVVPRKRGDDLVAALVNAGYATTFNETRGGMLRQSQLSLFIAVKAEEVSRVVSIIRGCCSTGLSIHQGFGLVEGGPVRTKTPAISSGAVVFVWSLDSFELP